jgi:hypothetical protein
MSFWQKSGRELRLLFRGTGFTRTDLCGAAKVSNATVQDVFSDKSVSDEYRRRVVEAIERYVTQSKAAG